MNYFISECYILKGRLNEVNSYKAVQTNIIWIYQLLYRWKLPISIKVFISHRYLLILGTASFLITKMIIYISKFIINKDTIEKKYNYRLNPSLIASSGKVMILPAVLLRWMAVAILCWHKGWLLPFNAG